MDVTDKVIATNGVFTLEPGQTVDFKRLATAIANWELNHDDDRQALVALSLLSGGVGVSVYVSWEREDESGIPRLITSPTDTTHYYVELHGLGLWRGGHGCIKGRSGSGLLFKERLVPSYLPALLSTEFVMFRHDCGTSYLTGICIDYEDVAEGDFMR